MPQKPYRGLDQLMDGAITKRFNDELTRLWDNVYDMRAPATKARTITLKVTIKPNANRDAAAILYDIKARPPRRRRCSKPCSCASGTTAVCR